MVSKKRKKQCTVIWGLVGGEREGGGDCLAIPVVPTNPNSKCLNSKED